MAKLTTDKFANRASVTHTLVVADEIGFKKFDTNVSIHDKVGWIIHRIEYHISIATIALLTATGDYVWCGITSSGDLNDLYPNRAQVYDSNFFGPNLDHGVAASGELVMQNPLISDFCNLPGGGILVPPEPLYLGIKSVGLGTPAIVRCRLYYTMLAMSPADYWDLMEATRLTG